jgi:glutamate dehydrogenase
MSLPDDKGLAERAQQKRGLTAPEIAVLLAYAKIALKETLLASSLPDSEDVHQLLVAYFPAPLLAHASELLPAHPLKARHHRHAARQSSGEPHGNDLCHAAR